jgi:hypothetical protein
VLSDAELYRRGTDTVLACSEAYTSGTSGAAVRRLPALAARSLRGERAQAVAAMEAAYADAGLARLAAWTNHISARYRASQTGRRGAHE